MAAKGIVPLSGTLATLVIMLTAVLTACTPGAVSSGTAEPEPAAPLGLPEVVFQGEKPGELIQTFEIDNCTGKANITRVEERSQSVNTTVSTEVALMLGLDAQVIYGEVTDAVGAAASDETQRGTKIELVAPPGTRMLFELVWKGTESAGYVINIRGVQEPIVFSRFVPTDVVIGKSFDLGCLEPEDSQTEVETPTPVVVIEPPIAPESDSSEPTEDPGEDQPGQDEPTVSDPPVVEPAPVESQLEPVQVFALISPPHGIYKNPLSFEWSGPSNLTYNVTLTHVDGYKFQSGYIADTEWTVTIPDEQFGNWTWWVQASDGRATELGTFVFNPHQPPEALGIYDLNGDCRIDEEDLAAIHGYNLGCTTGEVCFNPSADFDNDGIITSSDVNEVASRLGRPIPGCEP